MSDKLPYALVHGRFQPPHNGHLRYFLAALEKTEHLTIGICTPEICTKEYAEKTGYPCTAELNPYSFDERCTMIDLAFSELGIQKSHYDFVSLRSDYTDIEKIVPKDVVFFMSETDTHDTHKTTHLETLGYTVQTILKVDPADRTEKSGNVRAQAEGWATEVSPLVAEYIRTHPKI